MPNQRRAQLPRMPIAPFRAEHLARSGQRYKAMVTLSDAPVARGTERDVTVKVKNAATCFGGREARLMIAPTISSIYRRSLARQDAKLLTEMDGRRVSGSQTGRKWGSHWQSAQRNRAEYILSRLVQEQVAWFGDKGSPTTNKGDSGPVGKEGIMVIRHLSFAICFAWVSL